jgi:short-subunit dehydrogenase
VELKGTVGILTGASRGIGVPLAERLAREGVSLALAARSSTDLERTAEKVRATGVRVITVPTDVTDAAALQNLVTRTTEELGPPDLLVNNAGVEKYSRFDKCDPSDIEWVIKTNVVALEMLTRMVVPGMIERGHGHVVNIASLAGKTAVPYNSVYSSSKHAVVGFSWSLREELRPLGVGVSVVCPGFVGDVGMYASRGPNERAPRVAGTVTPQNVVDATIKAISKNRAEILVARGISKIVDVFQAISPEMATAVPRRAGLYRFLEKEADRPSTPTA